MNKETLPQINVGETLRMARERTGQDLRYVADMLRIRYVYLEAIEKGDYQKLPGATYAIGFVRAYADHLNLNSVQIVERFKQEQDDLDQQTQLLFPKPLPEGKVPSGGILLVAVVLGVLVYGAWFFLSGQDKPIAELIPEIPARLMALVGAGEEEDGETGPAATADADGADQATDADEALVAEPTEDTAPDDEAEADAAVTQAAPSVADEEPPVSDETAAADDPEPIPEETAEPVAEDTPAEADETGVAATADAPAASEEPVSEPVPATETETVEAVSATPPAEAAEEEPAVEETVAEPPAAEETATAQTMETPAATEPGDTAEARPTAKPEPDSDGDTPVASAPAQTDTQVSAAAETAETTAADEDTAAIAQRVLEELGRADEPAASRPLPATAGETQAPASSGARVNGDSAGAEAPAASAQQPSGEVPVAAITPAARTQDAPTADEPAAAAPGNGTGPAPASVVPVRPGGKVYGTENAQSRILITARVDSWVEVSTQQGELLLTRVLRAGDSFRVPDQEGLSLVTGNAGGLAISVDGAQVPDLGPVGAVRRGVELDPDRLKAGTAGNL